MFLIIEEFECNLECVVDTGVWYGYGYNLKSDGTTDVVFGTGMYLEDCEMELKKAIEEYYSRPIYAKSLS